MATTVPGTPTAYPPTATAPAPSAVARSTATERAPRVPWYIWGILAASTCVVGGVIWDISWHMTIGRDGLFSPPHLASYLGGALVGGTCGWLALKTTFRGTAAERARSVRVWGFHAPFGAWVCVWGAFAMLTSAPFDDWWHDAYGLDVQIISPPHTLLLFGMLGIVVGAMLMTVAYQNQVDERARRAPGVLYLYAMGLLLTMASVFTTEYSYRYLMHGPRFYGVSALVYPLLLVAAVRGSSLRWPATSVAAMYMAARALATWVLPLFPGEPRLGPVYQEVTRFVPMDFPLLLVVPALAIDLVMRAVRRRAAAHGAAPDAAAPTRRGAEWALAAALSVAFVAALLAAQWPFADFLNSPASRTWVFATHRLPYMAAPGTAFTNYTYAPWELALGAGDWARGLAWAVVGGTLSARLGLAWGAWMARVRR
jgi:hypothetical protein